MKLSLRKAHRLVNELQMKLSVRQKAQTIHHSADNEEVINIINDVQEQNHKSVLDALLIVDAITEIRRSVQVQNDVFLDGNSVNSLLSEKVKIESKMKVLAGFSHPRTDTQEQLLLKTQRDVIDSVKNTMYSSSATVTGYEVSVHNGFNLTYVELKKEQENISDKLSYINNQLHIEVDEKFKELFSSLQVL